MYLNEIINKKYKIIKIKNKVQVKCVAFDIGLVPAKNSY